MTDPTMHALFDGSDHGLIPTLAGKLKDALRLAENPACEGVDAQALENGGFRWPATEAVADAFNFLRDNGAELAALLAEHESLLRRVAEAPVAIAGAGPGRFYYAGADTIEHGQRVRILAEAGEA